ncbi:hypothetical protein [Daejeonella oryzae]|uniref:hypothetical protein n=1 Tax=Daejeonella oryzae TaxID=1122943 RepID=UPI00041F487A|nr:hypothetical protein [Daejeonella oryzae]
MTLKSKHLSPFLLIFILLFSACGTSQKGRSKRPDARVVPIAINIQSGNNHDLNFVNMDYYRLQVLDQLDNFLNVDLDLVEADENPEVVLDLNIDNFVLWPKSERISRRTLRRVIQVGNDSAGKPIYQTIVASVDIINVERRSNARFTTTLTFKGADPKTYKQSFYSNFNYANTYVDNIQGDPRAVDPSLYSMRSMGMEPVEIDFLLNLSRRDMLPRLSYQFRSYYK